MTQNSEVIPMEMPDFESLAVQFDQPGVSAVVLMGSHARGTAGRYSDIDLVRFREGEKSVLPGLSSHLIDGRLVVVSEVTPSQLEAAFEEPQRAVESILGLRSGRALLDRDNSFAAIQERANSFKWDATMQAKANLWASQQMVGWTEEVYKGLEGLLRDDTGRLLNARFGCSWGMARVMCVQRGILLSGDNSFYEQVTSAAGPESAWTRQCQAAFAAGPKPLTLHEQVKAGLQLYVLTAELLAGILLPENQPLVDYSVALIKEVLSV